MALDLKEGKRYLSENQFERALRFFKDCLEENYEPQWEVLSYLAETYRAKNDFDNAISYYQEAKETGYPSTGKIYYNIASVYLNKCEYEMAGIFFKNASRCFQDENDKNGCYSSEKKLEEVNRNILPDVDPIKQIIREVFYGIEITKKKKAITLYEKILGKEEDLNAILGKPRTLGLNDNFLVILKEYSSFTPLISLRTGGGYLLVFGGRGYVIDPGHNFLHNFFAAGFSISDIDGIIITHPHDDHVANFEGILTLVYQLRKRGISDKKIGIYINESTYKKYEIWLDADKEFIDPWEISLNPNEPMTYLLPGYHGEPLSLKITRTIHNVLLKKDGLSEECMGLIFEGINRVIIFSSDTRWSQEMAVQYKDYVGQCNILVLNLGSIKEKELKYLSEQDENKYLYENHLGLIGTCKFINYMRPELAILSEFGEELGELRGKIAEEIKNQLDCKCLPGYLGMMVSLEDNQIRYKILQKNSLLNEKVRNIVL